MPAEHRIDPTWLDVVATQLARSGAAALDASDELMAHYSDTGDATTQRLVDALVNQAADALSALTESLVDSSRTLRAATAQESIHEPSARQHSDADGSSDRSGPSSAWSGRGLDHDE